MEDVLALYILQFDEFFEVDSSGRAWKTSPAVVNRRVGGKLKGPEPEKRAGPIPYLRYPLASSAQGTEAGDLLRLRMQQISQHVGRSKIGKVRDMFFGLAGIAANKICTKRGWVTNAADEALGGQEIADILDLDLDDVAWGLEIMRHFRLVEWRPCPFANQLISPVSFGITEQEKEGSLNSASPLNQIPNTNKEQAKDQGAAETRADATEGSDLGGLPPGGSESLGDLDLEGLDLEDADLDLDNLGLENLDLTGASRRQGGKAPFALGKKAGWYHSLNGLELAKISPQIIAEELTDNQDFRKEVVIERALYWLKKMSPEYLDPRSTASREMINAATGCEVTITDKMEKLFEKENVRGVIWFVGIVQKKRVEVLHSRGRLRNYMALAVNRANERLGIKKKVKN